LILRGFEFESQDLSRSNECGPEKDRPDRPTVQKIVVVVARVTFFPGSSLFGRESGDGTGENGR
jgi:hypothetical protein